jgi:hypothetical protein
MSLSDFFFLICGVLDLDEDGDRAADGEAEGVSSDGEDPFWREKTRERDLARFLCFGRDGGAVTPEPDDEVAGGGSAGDGDV